MMPTAQEKLERIHDEAHHKIESRLERLEEAMTKMASTVEKVAATQNALTEHLDTIRELLSQDVQLHKRQSGSQDDAPGKETIPWPNVIKRAITPNVLSSMCWALAVAAFSPYIVDVVKTIWAMFSSGAPHK